jgi:NAD(P)-dependent dehydrogenase (short-subunit alcohol dehydrogenase family)
LTYTVQTPDYGQLLRLDGRHVAVLGAGQGIGEQVAHAVAQMGARVSCVDFDDERGRKVAGAVGGVSYVVDATDRDGLANAFDDAVAAEGPLRGVVNIIGLAQWAPLVQMSEEMWATSYNDNLLPVVRALQVGAPRTAVEGASFVFVSSVDGIGAAPGHASYGAFKAGLMSLVRTAAVELGPRKIRVNSVAPGITWTPRVAAAQNDETRVQLDALHPIGRIGVPADIASALLFFLSDLSAWVTGQTLAVDGGALVNGPYELSRLPTVGGKPPTAQLD